MVREQPFSLSVGSVLSQALSVFLRNVVAFVLLGFLVMAPTAALQAAQLGGEPDFLWSLMAMLISLCLSTLLTGAITYGVVQGLRGQRAGVGAIFARGVRVLPSAVGTGLLMGILVGLGALLLIVPGIVLSVLWYVAIPVVVLEGKVGTSALGRSRALVAGSGWQVFALLVVVFALVAVMTIGAVFLDNPLKPTMTGVVLQWISGAVVGSFSSVLAAVAYYQLRMGKENVDADQVAAVFG